MVVKLEYPEHLVKGCLLDMWVHGKNEQTIKIDHHGLQLLKPEVRHANMTVSMQIFINGTPQPRCHASFVCTKNDLLCMDLYFIEKIDMHDSSTCTRRRSSVTFRFATGGVSDFFKLYEIPLEILNDNIIVNEHSMYYLIDGVPWKTYGSVSLDVPLAYHEETFTSEHARFPAVYEDTRHAFMDWRYARNKRVSAEGFVESFAHIYTDNDLLRRHVRTLVREPIWYPTRLSFHVPGPMALASPLRLVGTEHWWRQQLSTVKERRKNMNEFDAWLSTVKAWPCSRPYVRDWRITDQGEYELTDVFSHVQLQTANDCEDFALYTYYAWHDAARYSASLRQYVPCLAYCITTDYGSYANHCMTVCVRKDIMQHWLGMGGGAPVDGLPPFVMEDATIMDDGQIGHGDGLDHFANYIKSRKGMGSTHEEQRLTRGLKVRVHESDSNLHHYALINLVCNLSHCFPNTKPEVSTYVLSNGSRRGVLFTDLGKQWKDLRLETLDSLPITQFAGALSMERPLPEFDQEDQRSKYTFAQTCRSYLPMRSKYGGELHNVFVRAPLLGDTPSKELIQFLAKDVLEGHVRDVVPDVGDFVRFVVEWTPPPSS